MVASAPVTPIPTLRGSALLRTSAEAYQRHRGDVGGQCHCCGNLWPCPTRCHAAETIAAAGDSPHRYDQFTEAATAGRRDGDRRRQSSPATPATVTGYALGGRNRPSTPANTWTR